MKTIAFLLAVLTLVSCKKESEESFGKSEPIMALTSSEANKLEEKGKQIFEGKGLCVSCHEPQEKLIGPSLKDIAKIYKDKNGDMTAFFKGETEPIVDPSQYEIMKTNLELTKTFSEEELKALEAYVYSHSK